MRGTTVFAGVIMGLPAAAFAATWLLSDGAPLRSPAASGEGRTAVAVPVEVPVAVPGPAVRSPATAPRVDTVALRPDDGPPDDWARLEARAAQGDRDALMFLTLMRLGEPVRRAPR